jgi:rubredoxin
MCTFVIRTITTRRFSLVLHGWHADGFPVYVEQCRANCFALWARRAQCDCPSILRKHSSWEMGRDYAFHSLWNPRNCKWEEIPSPHSSPSCGITSFWLVRWWSTLMTLTQSCRYIYNNAPADITTSINAVPTWLISHSLMTLQPFVKHWPFFVSVS